VVTANSLPKRSNAKHWYEVELNGQIVGRIMENGVPTAFTTLVDKNALVLCLNVMERNGMVTKLPTQKHRIDVVEGQKVNVVHEKRRFIDDLPRIETRDDRWSFASGDR